MQRLDSARRSQRRPKSGDLTKVPPPAAHRIPLDADNAYLLKQTMPRPAAACTNLIAYQISISKSCK